MEIKQQLRMSQQLVMTPQLQQAIRLLQLSRLELIAEIRKRSGAARTTSIVWVPIEPVDPSTTMLR